MNGRLKTTGSIEELDLSDDARLLYRAQVEQLYSQAGPGMVGAFLSGVILVGALWRTIPPSSLLLWLGCYTALHLGRYFLVLRFRDRSPSQDNPGFWDLRFTMVTVVACFMWGLAGVFLFPAQSLKHQFLLDLFICGIGASTAVVYAPTLCYLPAVLAAILPISGRYIFLGDKINVTIGAAILVYAAVLVLTGRHIHDVNAASLKLQFEKNKLVKSLGEEKAEIEKLNEELKAEIRVRKKTEEAFRASEKKYREFAEFLPQIVYEIDARGKLSFLNRSGFRAFARGLKELVQGLDVMDVFLPDDRPRVSDNMRRLFDGEKVIGNQYTLLRKDGSTFPVVTYSSPIVEKGRVVGIRGVAVDITELKHIQDELHETNAQLESRIRERTAKLNSANEQLLLEIGERKKAEQRVRESEERYRTLVELAPDGIIVHDGDKLLFANTAAATILGTDRPEAVIGKRISDFLYPGDSHFVGDSVALSGDPPGTVRLVEKGFVRLDGKVAYVEAASCPFHYERQPAVLVVFRDVSDRKNAEEALWKANERVAKVLESISDGFFALDRDMTVTYFNRAAERLLSRRSGEVLGRNLFAAFPEVKGSVFEAKFRQGLDEKTPIAFETYFPVRPYDNWYDMKVYPYEEGISVCFQITTSRKLMQEALRDSEAKYRAIVENIEEGYYEVDLAGNMLFFNDSMCRILGYTDEELRGMNTRKYMSEATATKLSRTSKEVYVTGKPLAISGWNLVRKDGTPIVVDASVSLLKDGEDKPCGFRGVVRDVTERQHFQAQLAEAQKMEAIGTLAGGIAHDFNNILYAIIGYTELALDDAPQETQLRSNLEAVLSSGTRAKDLVNHILTFSRRSDDERKPMTVGPIVKEVMNFLRASLPSTIEIRQSISPDAKPILANSTRVHQVLMNLCANAGHSMREKGGVLSVFLEEVVLGAGSQWSGPQMAPGSYVRLAVSDTGCGIHPRVVDRIFEPYFTTKKAGEGTGLGLAIAVGIIKSYGGAITVKSEMGRGSIFEVYLPTIEAEVSKTGAVSGPVATGNERILFVDDEPSIADIGGRMLAGLGLQSVKSRK